MRKDCLRIFLLSVVIFLSSCFGPKYIPARYFHEKHSLGVVVKSLPTATHNINANYEQDVIKKLEKQLESTARTVELQSIFSRIDSEEIRTQLAKDVEKKVVKIFSVDNASRDLVAEIEIHNWGWIVPGERSFNFRLASYQLTVSGTVRVYDLNPSKKEIAYAPFRAQENISDRLSLSETQRAVKKVLEDASEIIAEFLWRSDNKE
jgi:hypothetical protein